MLLALGADSRRHLAAKRLEYTRMIRAIALNLLSVVAILSSLSAGILTLIFAISPRSHHQGLFIFPFAAAIVQLCSSLMLTTYVFVLRHNSESKSQRRSHLLLGFFAVLPSVTSAGILGASLGWCESATVSRAPPVFGIKATTYLSVTFIVWAVSVLANLVLDFAMAWVIRCMPDIGEERYSTRNTQNTRQVMVESGHSTTTPSVMSNPFQQRGSPSAPSSIRSDGISSLRSSFSAAQRPSSSKRRLTLRELPSRQQSRASSFDSPSRRPSQDEDFDSWDTSSVSQQVRETIAYSKAGLKGSGLEPIPGSRSPSPAKVLEGPFFQTSPSPSPPASPLPQPSVSQPGSAPISPLERSADLPKWPTHFPIATPIANSLPATPRQQEFSRPSSRSGPVSRSASIAVPRSRQGSRSRAPSEDHIHPLFRTSSPTPPPSASAGTNVTAAPEAGQLIDEHMLKRMRSASLASTSSPLTRSESSPDVSSMRVPPSPRLDTMPTQNLTGSRANRPHQRKRSASFQGNIEA